MSDEKTPDQSPHEEESFAEMFEAYSSGMNEDVQIGDKIQGKIISIGRDTVFVDTGTKIDGAVDLAELLDEQGNMPHEPGDELELYVVAATESELRLSKALSGIGGLNMLKDAFANKVPVEGKVTGPCKGGFNVAVMQRRAFCPVSQMDIVYIEKPEDYTDQIYNFIITRFEENGRNIVLSRRKLLQEEQAKTRQAFYEQLQMEDVYDGTITRLMPYGAFVKLADGVEGMAHVSELSWSRVENPADVVAPGAAVRVKVIGVQESDKPDQKKIALSMKQVDGDPWDTIDQQFKPGEKVRGKITRMAAFGAFIEIAPGIEGLVHISQISYTQRILKPEDVLTRGETVDVMIKEIDPVKRRIGLSIRDAEGDPWLSVGEKFTVGQTVAGTIEKKEKFGFFISLAPGITGLLPKSKISQSSQASALESLRPGQSIQVNIATINAAERKISLGPIGEQSDGEANWRQFSQSGDSAFGALGEKLQMALKKQKKT